MTTLTLEQVKAIVDAAFTGPRLHPSVLLAAAVVDASGGRFKLNPRAGRAGVATRHCRSQGEVMHRDWHADTCHHEFGAKETNVV